MPRKSYVQVLGSDGRWTLVEKSKWRPPDAAGPMFMPDIVEAVSPVDGTVVSSRSVRAEHNRRNGVIDVGDDPSLWRPEAMQVEPHGGSRRRPARVSGNGGVLMADPVGEGTEPVVEPEDDLRADLEAAIYGEEESNGVDAKGSDEPPPPPPVEGAETPPPPDPPVDADLPPEGGDEPPVDDIPTGRWTADERDKLAKMAPDDRAFLVDRYKSMQADYTKKSEEIAPIRKAIDEWAPYLEAINTSPERAFTGLLRGRSRVAHRLHGAERAGAGAARAVVRDPDRVRSTRPGAGSQPAAR